MLFVLNNNYKQIGKEAGQVGYYKNIYYVDLENIDIISEQLNYDQTLIHTESLYGNYQGKQIIGIKKDYHLFHTMNVLYGEVMIDPMEVVLNESAAYSYFGALDVVGKNITLNGYEYMVGGIVTDESYVRNFLNETSEIVYISTKRDFDFEYGKVEVYKSGNEIGVSYYDNFIQSSDKVDFLSLGKSQIQYTYFMLLPLLLCVLIIMLKKMFFHLKRVRDGYIRKHDEKYGFLILKETVHHEKKHIIWAIISCIGIIMIMVYLIRDVYFVETFLPDRLYELGDQIESLKLFTYSLIKPDFTRYIFESELLILHFNRWLMLIAFLYSCMISVKLFGYSKYIIDYKKKI